MQLRLIALSSLFVVAAVAGVWTRQAGPAQLALEAARKTEVVDRNLLAAIVQYRDVATKYESDRTVAPTALLQMAGCYEQLRQPEARATYELIVKYYPDSGPAKTARVKLAGQRETLLTVTRLPDNRGRPSLDGQYFTTESPSGDLAIRNMRSGTTRTLTRNATKASADDYGFVTDSVLSPDGRQIAYGWTNRTGSELRVINSNGSQERVLCCRETLGEVTPPGEAIYIVYGWSGDGKHILFGSARSSRIVELMTVPATGGVPRRLKELPIFGAAWSPDGHFIVYDAPLNGRKTGDHDLFIMHADGSNSEPLVTHAGHKRMLHWFPDGKRILFLSDRSGSYSVYAQSVVEGKAVGEPTLVKPLAGNLRGQGFTREGAYYYNVASVTDDVFTARVNASGALSGKLEPLPSRFSGGKAGGAWSPDGSRIAYVHVPLDVTSGPSLSIQTLATQEVYTIPVQLKSMANPAWMPDGRAIILEGRNMEGEHGLFRIELSSGAVSAVGELATTSAASRHYPAVSSNGREVVYGLGGGLRGGHVLDLGLSGIQAMDLRSGTQRMVFQGPVMNFALSPDGRFVAIASPNRAGTTRQATTFRIVPVVGGESRAVGAELAPEGHFAGFAWSADGRYLYFPRLTAERRTALWRVPVDGGPARPTDILFPKQLLFRISVHPDGLLAISTQAHDMEFWVMRNIPPAARR